MFTRIVQASLAFLLIGVAFGATPPISMISPHGGELFLVGQVQFVRLADNTKSKSVIVELSRDGGNIWGALGLIDNTAKTHRNVLQFTVTGPVSANCVIRATSIPSSSGTVIVSGGFIITDAVPNTAAGMIAGGDLAGAYPNPSIAQNAVTTGKIADLSVTAKKVTSGAASNAFVLSADGIGGADWVTALSVFPSNFGTMNIQTAGFIIASSFAGSGAGLTNLSASALPIVGVPYVLKSGDTLTGALTLSGSPTANLHAATKQYVDAETTRAQATESTFSTNLSAEITRATGAEGALAINLNNEFARSTTAESTKVAKTGDTMTGLLTLSGDPGSNLHAATKQYVDAERTRAQVAETTLNMNLASEVSRATAAEATLTANLSSENSRATSIEASKIAKGGDTMSGLLTLSGDPTMNLHAATKQYVDTETARATFAETALSTGAIGKVAKSGDTMTGLLGLSGDPIASLHAATKQYVDAEKFRAQGAESTITVNLSNEITRATAAEALLITGVNGKISKAGDTMTGPLTVQTGAGANVGLTVQGTGVTQSKNLQEWYNGGPSPVAAVAQDGTLSVPRVSIPTTTRYYSIHYSAFAGTAISYDFGYASISNSASPSLLNIYAPVNLPHGATITNFAVSTVGQGPLTISLGTGGGSTIATVASSQTSFNSALANYVVDNSSDTIYVKATGPVTSAVGVQKVFITYTITSTLP